MKTTLLILWIASAFFITEALIPPAGFQLPVFTILLTALADLWQLLVFFVHTPSGEPGVRETPENALKTETSVAVIRTPENGGDGWEKITMGDTINL